MTEFPDGLEGNNKREWKSLIDSYTKWAHDLCLGFSSLTSAIVSSNMRDFASQGLWPFPDAIFNFLFFDQVKDNWGKPVGFSSIKDVDLIQSNLKSI